MTIKQHTALRRLANIQAEQRPPKKRDYVRLGSSAWLAAMLIAWSVALVADDRFTFVVAMTVTLGPAFVMTLYYAWKLRKDSTQ